MPRITLEPRFQVEYLSILDSDGNLDTALEPKLADTDLRSLYRSMLLGRRLDLDFGRINSDSGRGWQEAILDH